ncbi:MAG: hypothetical protein Q8L48_44195 [Archangium sp.]|nr:hypothetical protein [Archangium sp.]
MTRLGLVGLMFAVAGCSECTAEDQGCHGNATWLCAYPESNDRAVVTLKPKRLFKTDCADVCIDLTAAGTDAGTRSPRCALQTTPVAECDGKDGARVCVGEVTVRCQGGLALDPVRCMASCDAGTCT